MFLIIRVPDSNINLGNVGLSKVKAFCLPQDFSEPFLWKSSIGSLLLRSLWQDYCSLEHNLRSTGVLDLAHIAASLKVVRHGGISEEN